MTQETCHLSPFQLGFAATISDRVFKHRVKLKDFKFNALIRPI